MVQVTIGLCTRAIDADLDDTFTSIANQEYPRNNIEIIVVTSRQRDAEEPVKVETLLSKGLHTRVFWDQGKGLATARQIVVDEASNPYIVWVDSDVILPTSFLQKQVAFIEANPSVGVAIGEFQHKEVRGKITVNALSLFWSMQRTVSLGATICRTRAFRESGGFDRRIVGASEDMDIAFRIAMNGWKIAVNEEAKPFHRQRETMKGLLRRGIWYGRGGHFMSHKYEGIVSIPYRLPPVYFASGLRISSRVHRVSGDSKSFLIPIVTTLFSTGWALGFVLGHLNGYGHLIRHSEIERDTTSLLSKNIRDMLK